MTTKEEPLAVLTSEGGARRVEFYPRPDDALLSCRFYAGDREEHTEVHSVQGAAVLCAALLASQWRRSR